MKKVLSIVLAFVFVVGVFATVPLASIANAASVDDLTFVLNDDEQSYCVSSCNTSVSGELVIPATYNDLPVTKIGDNAFKDCSSLTSVTIPESVASIGEDAFLNCTSLEKVEINDLAAWCNVVCGPTIIVPQYNDFAQVVGEIYHASNPLIYAKKLYLNGQLITDLVIPEGVTKIGAYAFSFGSFNSVIISESVKDIGAGAFLSCASLKNAIISDSVISMGEMVFYGCKSLERVTLGDGLTSIADSTFCDCKLLTSVTIGNNVTSIGQAAFYCCKSLESITIPESVTSIGEYAFYCCDSLKSITIPKSVTSIGEYAFGYSIAYSNGRPTGVFKISGFEICCSKDSAGYTYACDNGFSYLLEDVAGSEDLNFTLNSDGLGYTLIGFKDSSEYTKVNIPVAYNGLPVTGIGENAFKNRTLLKNVLIPDSVTNIGNSAFYNCSSLTSVTIGNNVTSIGQTAFYCCKSLKSITIPDSVINIGNSAFYNCSSLESVTISSSVTSIGDSAFYNCSSLTSVTIPDGVTSIGDSAFYNCSSLTSVTIPDGVTSIGDSAFYNCSSLTSVTIPDGVTSIGDSAFYNCSSLASVTIPDSVISIEYAAFAGCTRLKNLTIGTGVKHVGAYAFEYCSNLNDVYIKEITNWCNIEFEDIKSNPLFYAKNLYLNGQLITDLVIPGNVTEIKKLAFYGVPFNSVTINNGVTTIGMGAFYNSKSLTNVTIPTSVTTIGENAFYGCTGLKKVTVKDLGAWCGIDYSDTYSNPLYYAKVLYLNDELVTDLVIPEGVTEIKPYTFYNCSTLESVTIPESVTSIGEGAFAKCVQLKKVNISDIEKWCNITFASSTANPLSNSTGLYLDDKIIRNVILPETLTEVKAYTFTGNRFLKSVKLPDTIEKIGTSAFEDCINLELLVLSENLTDIGGSAFKGCKSLETVTIPKSLKNIGGNAFYANDALKYVFYPGSMLEWNEIAIGGSNFTTNDLVIHYNSTDHTYMEVINEPIFEGVEGTREEICSVCGHVGKEEKIEFINSYLAGVTEFDVALDAPTNYLVANISASKDLNESIVVVDGYTLNTTPNSDYGYYGTGSKVQVLDDNGLQVDEYTLVVRGDVNGDSVCDVLDCMLIELARNNHKELDGVYLSAGDLAENGVIDDEDFNAVVNKAIA